VPGTLDHTGHGLCVLVRRGQSVCWLGGGGKVDVGRDWYGWVCIILYVPVNCLSSCKCQCPGMVGGHLLLFPW